MIENLLGRWRSRGHTVDGLKIAGTDVYEWFDGGKFLVHHVDVTMGADRVRVLEMIGPVDEQGIWPMRAFDSGGGYDEMTLRVDADGGIVLTGDQTRSFLTFGAPSASAVGTAGGAVGAGAVGGVHDAARAGEVGAAGGGPAAGARPATMAARWERLVDGRWEHWMDMEFTRDGAD